MRWIARPWLEKARPTVERRVLAPAGAVVETARAVGVRARISLVRQRAGVVRRFPEPVRHRPAPRVVAVLTHVVDPQRDRESGVERLRRTLEGLLESLDHARVELVLNTLPGQHVENGLPDYLRSRLEVRERVGVEPLFLGFEAQQEFVERQDTCDWFMFLEDDLVLRDALLLEKLAYFNDAAPPEAVLLPHRYELWNGRKMYIDLRAKRRPGENRVTGRLTRIDVGGWSFAEFENPHSGWYCLSRAQLERWLATGRRWYGLASFQDPRASAATGCLEECFRLYKPHPDNMNFLELHHLGTKYSEIYAGFHGPESLIADWEAYRPPA
ncbi:MAG TPA: hypothetical protein VFA19_05050 [Gaiellaceae bacterium]|nr:hypothetical protein [Gaiellaceae bacterium]